MHYFLIILTVGLLHHGCKSTQSMQGSALHDDSLQGKTRLEQSVVKDDIIPQLEKIDNEFHELDFSIDQLAGPEASESRNKKMGRLMGQVRVQAFQLRQTINQLIEILKSKNQVYGMVVDINDLDFYTRFIRPLENLSKEAGQASALNPSKEYGQNGLLIHLNALLFTWTRSLNNLEQEQSSKFLEEEKLAHQEVHEIFELTATTIHNVLENFRLLKYASVTAEKTITLRCGRLLLGKYDCLLPQDVSPNSVILRIEMLQQHSFIKCKKGVRYGIYPDARKMWTKQGCVADFSVTIGKDLDVHGNDLHPENEGGHEEGGEDHEHGDHF